MKPSFVQSELLQHYLEKKYWIAHDASTYIRYTPNLKKITDPQQRLKMLEKELIVPKNITDRKGLYSHMIDLWENLTEIFDKSEKDMVLEILNSNVEIVTIRLIDEDTKDGSVGFNRLVPLINTSKNLIGQSLLSISNKVRLNTLDLKNIQSVFQKSRVIGIEQGSFILKVQMPTTLSLKDQDMYGDPSTIYTDQSFKNATENIDFFNNKIIPSVNNNTLEQFVSSHLEEIQSNVLFATIKMINKFPKSLIEFSNISHKTTTLTIDSTRYNKEGMSDISTTIKRIIEEEKKHERIFEGLVYEYEDGLILNGQNWLSIHIKDEDKNIIAIPQIDIAYRNRVINALNNKQKIRIKGIVKQEKIKHFKIVQIKEFIFNPN